MKTFLSLAIMVLTVATLPGCSRSDTPSLPSRRLTPSDAEQTVTVASHTDPVSNLHVGNDEDGPLVLDEQKGTAYSPVQATTSQQLSWAVVYDDGADARASVATAVSKAEKERKNVLIMFGGNWCNWCFKLHDVFTKDIDVAPIVNQDYVVVHVSLHAKPDHMTLATEYGIEDIEAQGVPFLTILDDTGKVLVNQATPDLERGRHYDIAKMSAFLKRWAPTNRTKGGS